MDEVVEQGCYISLAGSFNPAIFNPHWMARVGAISAEDADRSETEVTHRDVARFALPGLKLDVTAERLHLIATAEPFIKLVDIIGKTFSEALPHTPITALGMSYYKHHDLQDWSKRVRFGRLLAPITPWGDFGATFEADDVNDVGGLIDIQMQIPRRDGSAGFTRATVQPSNTIPNGTGIFLQVSSHFEEKPLEKLSSDGGNRAQRRSKRLNTVESPIVVKSKIDYPDLLAREFQPFLDFSRNLIAQMTAVAIMS